MSNLGKSIRIYLADGTPAGIRHAELVNWTGQAFVCPRGRLAELKSWEESKRPGVYFLVGEDEDRGLPLVYIGEAESVHSRLLNQVDKAFWTRAVFFTSKDENLTKAHVKYLEARLVALAIAAGRAQLQNGNSPQLPALPRADRDAMEEFLQPLDVLLSTLGLPILTPVGKTVEIVNTDGVNASPGLTGRRLYFNPSRGAVNASGAVSDEGFVVLAGSTGDSNVRDHLGKGRRAFREQLLGDGRLVPDGDCVRFVADVLFTSPSAAAAVVAGGSYNGREAWKDGNGTMLKILEENEQ